MEKSTLDNEDLAKRCFHAERERDETQLKLEQVQQAQKLLQQRYEALRSLIKSPFADHRFSFEAEKSGHQAKQQELSERVQKVSIDLDRTTADYTTTFTELNELKKKLSLIQNEQMLSQRRMTDLVSIAPNSRFKRAPVSIRSDQTTRRADVREGKGLSHTLNPAWWSQSNHLQRTEESSESTTTNDCQVGHSHSVDRR